MMTDPIGDLLTRIRNAGRVGHSEVRCASSKLKEAIAGVLVGEGYLRGCKTEAKAKYPVLVLELKYRADGAFIIDGMQRVSRPSCRVYKKSGAIPRVRNGLGMLVVSTSKGVMCDREARAGNLGGEVLCEVW